MLVWVRRHDDFWAPTFWNWRTSKTVPPSEGSASLPGMISVSPDGTLAAVIYDKDVIVMNSGDGSSQAILPVQADIPTWAEFSRDGHSLVTGSNGGRTQIWSTERDTNGPSTTLLGHLGVVSEAHFSPTDPQLVVTAGYDGTVRLWQLPRRKVLAQSGSWMQQATVNASGTEIVSVSDYGALRVSSLATGKLENVWLPPQNVDAFYERVQWLPGRSQAVVSAQNTRPRWCGRSAPRGHFANSTTTTSGRMGWPSMQPGTSSPWGT